MQKANTLILVLLLILAGLQYRLWFGDSGILHSRHLAEQIREQQRENEHLLQRNRMLEAEVAELKRGHETVEERARNELGMLKNDETLYLITE